MNKILTFFFLFLVVCYCKTYSQQFNNNYLLDKPAAVFRGIHIVNDTIITYGFLAENYYPYPAKYALSKIDLDGNFISTHYEVLDSFKQYFPYFQFIVSEDSSYVFTCVKGETVWETGFLIKLDKTGNLVFAKEFTDTSNSPIALMNVYEIDSGYLVLGNINIGQRIDLLLVKTDFAGNEIWRKLIEPTPSKHYVRGFFKLNNGNFLISTDNANIVLHQEISSTIFIEINTNGDVINKWMDNSKNTYGAKGYFQTENNNAIYCGSWIDTTWKDGVSLPEYYVFKRGYIVREDSLHNKIWELKLGQSSTIPDLFQLKRITDGNYITVGGTYDSTYTDGQPYKNTGWLIKFDIDGNVIWQRKYFNTEDYPGQTNYLYDFVELPNRDIIAAGERIDWINDYPQRGWLLRLDEYGCLVPGCQHVGINESENDTRFFSIYPNPISDRLYLYFNSPYTNENYSVKIYTYEGKEITSVPKLQDHSTYIVNTQSFSKGTYVVVFFKNNQIISSQKIIKP